MAKSNPSKESTNPKKGEGDMPQDAWDKFDNLMDKALGVEKKPKKKRKPATEGGQVKAG